MNETELNNKIALLADEAREYIYQMLSNGKVIILSACEATNFGKNSLIPIQEDSSNPTDTLSPSGKCTTVEELAEEWAKFDGSAISTIETRCFFPQNLQG